jgi:hypothetical protein
MPAKLLRKIKIAPTYSKGMAMPKVRAILNLIWADI